MLTDLDTFKINLPPDDKVVSFILTSTVADNDKSV